MSRFSYLPARGPLPGASFEAQTTAFLESLANESGKRFDELQMALRNMQSQIEALVKTNAQNVVKIQQLQESISLLTQRVEQLEYEVRTKTIPEGFIGLMYTQNSPDFWTDCDWQNETPDLSAYAVKPLRYVQRLKS